LLTLSPVIGNVMNKIEDSPLSILYVSHGGGPLPLLGDESHREMVANLRQVTAQIARPAAIIVISAHWEAGKATITAGANPSLIYDYYGFPKQSYEIQYPVSGEPALARKVLALLKDKGIDAELDDQRGFDHGLFVPLKIMYPEADIPCIQLSLVDSLNPVEHIKLGEALAGLGKENVLVTGSGFSFHNLRAFFAPVTAESQLMNESFERWLIDTCSDRGLDERDRAQRLACWEDAPAARYCHPREEHLLPLHVCYGTAGRACRKAFELNILGRKASAYLW
jgi:aromatic ring-opening dioxygenase catalytic subunit (LigB family)